jgi:hypothetical protein
VERTGNAKRILFMNIVLAALNLAASLAWSILQGTLTYIQVRNTTATLLFVEAGALFLVGGFTAYGGSIFVNRVRQQVLRSDEEWTPEKAKESEQNASVFVVLAGLMLVESLLLSII